MTDQSAELIQEQIKEFWEWCGLTEKLETGDTYHCWYKDEVLVFQYYHFMDSVDLNNLFKYAVPKLDEYSAPSVEYAMGKFCEAIYKHQDPALALFWAIWEVIKR